jgi:putative tryptophan/tyrosine transport system substrate-binding protein
MTAGASLTRRFVLVSAGALLLPASARAQIAVRRRIGYLASPSRPAAEPFLGAFREGLRTLGDGDEDIAIEIRFADGHLERLPNLAAELVQLAPEVIVATSTAAVQAAKEATSTIPIVMAVPGDPVAAGFVASIAHPGGNVTGLSIAVSNEIAGKGLQLLHASIPGAKRIAVLVNPRNPGIAPIWMSRGKQREPCT